jgi:hypothetical protein
MLRDDVLAREYYYHGSRGGIEGPIVPVSRSRADFGRAFYLSTDATRTKLLVMNDVYPCEYTLSVDFSLDSNQRLVLVDGLAWLYTILHFGRHCDAFNDTPIDRWVGKQVDDSDWIVGAIADDSLSYAVRDFFTGRMTTEGVNQCLREIPHGYQLAAKTTKACGCIRVVSEYTIDEDEVGQLENESRRIMDRSRTRTEQIRTQTLHQGMNVLELVETITTERVAQFDPPEVGFRFLVIGSM